MDTIEDHPFETRTILIATALASVLAAQAALAEVGASERAAIEAVIRAQMAAFARDDGEAAFAHASADIRDLFQTADAFMAMVRSGYQPVYRPRQVDFLEAIEGAGGLAQKVFVVGPDGAAYLAIYPMERQPDGSWKIDGCYLARPDMS
ncbi:MAG: DUF4864 domain-containing protein [Rhodospirillales bacterium]|nr:DUF4864 domain-containing protein [Rhodospirillales bacterium]